MASRSIRLVAGVSIALGLGALAGTAQAATILSDGTFTAPSGGGSFATYPTGPMGPWNVTGSVDLIGLYWDAPAAGQGSVDLDGNAAIGSISQQLNLPGAGTYTLSFDLSGNPDGGPATKDLNVSVGSLASQSYSYTLTGANAHNNMLYDVEKLVFTWNGIGPAPILTFSSTDPAGNSYGPVIGNVAVAIPEPASWVMMVLGVGMIGGGLRMVRRKNPVGLASA